MVTNCFLLLEKKEKNNITQITKVLSLLLPHFGASRDFRRSHYLSHHQLYF